VTEQPEGDVVEERPEGVREREGDVVAEGRIEQREKFLWVKGGGRPRVRDRSSLPDPFRKLERVAPEEIAEAVLAVGRASLGIDLHDVPVAVCRLLGFARTSEEMTEVVVSVTKKLASTGMLQIDDGHFKVTAAATESVQTSLRLIPR